MTDTNFKKVVRYASGIGIIIAVAGTLGVGQIKLFGLSTKSDVEMLTEAAAVKDSLAIENLRNTHNKDISVINGMLICIYRDMPPEECPSFERAMNNR